MRLDLYQQETATIAALQGGLLDEAAQKLQAGQTLSALEQNGVLHALQILIENAIGKAKHLLKASDQTVPVSAYDAFLLLAQAKLIAASETPQWNNAVGLRNKIVHDYMNLRMDIVLALVVQQQYRFIVNFLQAPIPSQLSTKK
ncbi:MAG: DUF86 domain-containing protein [Oxalobacteraceae bacterium]|nr:DUF86 domain-containing protein [Oxalobacteraceae bacterium]